MPRLRAALALVLSYFLCSFATSASGAQPPTAVLTLASHAHLNEAEAFPGLSVYEGERLSTETQGRLGVRAGQSALMLGENTGVELIPLDPGLHIDVLVGSVHFSAAPDETVELHVAEATVAAAGHRGAQAVVSLLQPRVLQITAERGNLGFRYRAEFRVLPEGQTYRVYLDQPDDGTSQIDAQPSAKSSRILFYIVGAAALAGTIWGIDAALRSERMATSPAKP